MIANYPNTLQHVNQVWVVTEVKVGVGLGWVRLDNWYNQHSRFHHLDIQHRNRVDMLFRNYCWRLSMWSRSSCSCSFGRKRRLLLFVRWWWGLRRGGVCSLFSLFVCLRRIIGKQRCCWLNNQALCSCTVMIITLRCSVAVVAMTTSSFLSSRGVLLCLWFTRTTCFVCRE